ncbi:TonB-dependent receptor [Novosphingobium resinovorum]|uniref:TonB-dependent receptor n=1 Tax=Novosphingobium resinovorum TaxID=158500 RepID=A0A031JYU0_9SPHN|nr:TonB-dependent receptor [Novosphingobium resinovorum]EZP82881.1 TonB-dependent receptor [Novosphingobium resinovorum]
MSGNTSCAGQTARAVIVSALLCGTAVPALADDLDTGEHADIVVTADGSAESRARQRDAPNIVQSISQEEAFRLLDLNAGEAIARLPGVTIGADKGVGHFVNIRGLDADLTSTTFGGTHLPPPDPVTPQGGGRAFSFDVMPTGVFGSLTLTKTNRPDMDAEALGGTIEISPKAIPTGRDHFLTARLGSGEQLSRHTGVVDLSASGGIRFGDKNGGGPFSIVGSLAYYRDALGMDDRRTSYVNKASAPDLAWSSMSQSYNTFRHVTKGGSIEFAYEPDADTRFYARYLNTGYQEDNWRQQLAIKTSGTATANADGTYTSPVKQLDKSLRDTLLKVNLQLAEIGGRNKLGDLALDYHVSFAQGREYRPYDTISTFTSKPGSANITYGDAGGYYPSYTVTGTDPFGTGAYKLSSLTNNDNLYRTREWSGAVNAALPTALTGGANESIKFGVAVRLRTNTHVINPYTATTFPSTGPAVVAPGANAIVDQSHYSNGPDIDIDAMRGLWSGGTGTGFGNNVQADAYAGGLSRQDNRENVFAGYVQGEADFSALHLLAGLRAEFTDARYQGNTGVPITSSAAAGGTITNGKGSILVPTSSTSRYTNLFPSLQARYEFSPSLIARAVYSSTIARPGFNQVNPSATIDAANNIVTTGNPNLKPITANSFDLSVEHYLPFGGIVSAGVFDKELSNYIFNRTQSGGITDPVTLAVLGNQATPTQVVTYANISHAWVRGIELNYDQHLSFLPGPLSNLGVSGNYTLIDSSADIRPGEKGPLPASSKHIYNAAVYWDDGKLNVRTAISYAGRSLWSVGTTRALDQYAEARFMLDIGASYAVTDNVSIYASGRNLLNTPKIRSEGTRDHTVQHQLSGSAVFGGVNVQF